MREYIYAHSQILIDECPGYGVQAIPRFKSQCENMTFSYQIRYNRMLHQVIYKGGESSINYIRRFHNVKALSTSVTKSYAEDQLMHTFLEIFRKCGNYFAQIAIHQADLRR